MYDALARKLLELAMPAPGADFVAIVFQHRKHGLGHQVIITGLAPVLITGNATDANETQLSESIELARSRSLIRIRFASLGGGGGTLSERV
jgi:hypothetical protein